MIHAKHQLIRNDLKAKITRGVYAHGRALPSQSQLMSEYGVALGTVRQALDRLQAEGLVVSHRGKGTFVCHPEENDAAPSAITTMGLIIISPVQDDLIINDQLLTLQQAVASHAHELAVQVFSPSAEEAAIHWAKRHQGVIVWGQPTRALVTGLLAKDIPTVVIGDLMDGEFPTGASWVRFDLDALVSTALQIMTDMGHQKIWLINRGSSAYYRSLTGLFEQHAASVGVHESSRELVLEQIEDEPALIEHLSSAEETPTALLIEGDLRACRFIHLLHQAGWSVPQQISVVALGAAEPHRLGVSELSRVITPPDVGVVRAAEALAETIETGRVVRHTIATRFALGKTCTAVDLSKHQ